MMPRPSLGNLMLDRLILPGMLSFTRFGYQWRSGGFSPLPDLSGRHVVVTGATSGLGLATSRRLADLGASLTLIGRNAERLALLQSELQAEASGRVHTEVADLALLADVRQLAERLHRQDDPIHVLVNNAGTLFNDYQQTSESIERNLALNLLSPFLLTQLLLPRLGCSAPSRVITVSSGGMYLAPLDVAALEHPPKPYNGTRQYALAKRAQVELGSIWAEELTGSGVDVYTMHPGWADTRGVRDALPLFHRLTAPVLRSAEQGADTIVYLAAAGNLEDHGSGGFWFDREVHPQHVVPWTAASRAQRPALREMLQRLTHYGDSATPESQ
jgi:dehydrogenase/reductase SDR family protein 12